MLKNFIADKNVSSESKSDIKVKQSDLVFFTSQLSVMLGSGVVLSDAVEAVASQTKSEVFQNVLYDISDAIQNGDSLSDSLSNYPKIFSSMFVSVVKASEAAGRMPEMLDVLNKYLENEMDTSRQVKGALVYPCIMLVMAVIATATLMFFVLPKFTKIYESRGQALPKLTQILVSCSKVAGDFQSAVILFSVLGVIAAGVYYALTTDWGKRVIDYLKVRTPVLGTMFVDTIMTRSMRIMSTMLNSGVTLFDTLGVIKNASGNHLFQRFWIETSDRVEAGFQLSEAMNLAANSELVAPAIIQMIQAGEKGGTLANVCDRVSIYYEKKLKSSIKAVTSMIEPLMIIIMGAVIGTIAIALLLPIFRISSVMAH